MCTFVGVLKDSVFTQNFMYIRSTSILKFSTKENTGQEITCRTKRMRSSASDKMKETEMSWVGNVHGELRTHAEAHRSASLQRKI
jgi:hypothetical protein